MAPSGDRISWMIVKHPMAAIFEARRRKDELQVMEYVAVVKEMGYENVEGYLWYVEICKIKQVA